MNDATSQKIRSTLLSPLFLFSVGLMIVNDHALKGSGLVPPAITGKLSDFAFLFLAPVFVSYLFRVKTMKGLGGSYALVSVLFAAINISPWFSRFVESLFQMISLPLSLWPDRTDLIALIMAPCSFIFLLREKKIRLGKPGRLLELGVVVVCGLTCAATSPAMRRTHEPLYMTWEDLRTSVEVMPPREILKRGKIYIKDNYLYVNEPNKGIHIFDNSHPENPIPQCFLSIPGNTDLSIKGSFLYADSYVDLLIFALTIHPEDIILVNRIEDVFPYNPYQTRPFTDGEGVNRGGRFYPTDVDKNKGVVIGWRGIQGR